MQPCEAKFREVEKQLDTSVECAIPALEASGITCQDNSSRSYHYKVGYLMWEQIFTREWDADLQTALVQVRLLYPEPVHPSDPVLINVWVSAEKYRPGQESTLKERTESKVQLEALLETGLEAVVIQQFKIGAKIVGQAL